jgi:2-hydroxychromene-2-carboxylate isomerase
MTAVDFYFDLASPYSYLAATQLDQIVARTGAAFRWRPVVLAAVFKATGNHMPAQSPAKAKYMYVDLQRWAERYDVPFRFSSRWPMAAIRPHRLIYAALQAYGEAEAAHLGRRLFDAVWVDDRDPNDASELTQIADAAGLPGAALLAATETQPVKDLLRVHTDEAIARGMFGAPTFCIGDQIFWGNDRLEFLEAALGRARKSM